MDPKWYKAAMTGDSDFLKSLSIEDNISNFLSQITPKNNTVLHVAAEFNKSEFVQEVTNRYPLLLHKANSKGDTPLHVAARAGYSEIVGFFISHPRTLQVDVESGQVDQSHKKELLQMVNVDKDTALHCATRNGHYQSVKLLIEADPKLSNLINNADESPLYLAASKGLTGIAELILSAASPSSSSHVGPNGITALHATLYSKSQSNHFQVINLLR
jgi:ankyrin repeat protein